MGILWNFGVQSSISSLNPRTAAEHLCLELPEDTLAWLLKGKWAPILDSPSPSQGGGKGGGVTYLRLRSSWAASGRASEPIWTTCSKHNYLLCFDHIWHLCDRPFVAQSHPGEIPNPYSKRAKPTSCRHVLQNRSQKSVPRWFRRPQVTSHGS